MNLIEKQILSQARHLLAKAHKHEPKITADLQIIASELSAEIAGLENKFKTIESLTEKIIKLFSQSFSYFLLQGYTTESALEESFSRTLDKSNDILRYTFIFPNESYIFGYKISLTKLGEFGYKVPKDKIWNAWKNIGTIFDKGYRGINITIISSEKQKFELQFHTEESFHLKTRTHKLYKERSLAKTSDERKSEITRILLELAKDIPMPQGVKKL